MIELDPRYNQLRFFFPEVHPKASMTIDFQRTLRIPDDERTYPLPPALGPFPLKHVDDHADRVPESWKRHGGVMFPMYQSEAMWLRFDAPDDYACAVKIAAGKINAVSGDPWADGLSKSPQNYLQVPEQPWLDGFCVENGLIRQFVAMPFGAGYSAEEQLTGAAEFGGLQIEVFPLKAEFYRPQQYPTMAGACVQDVMFCSAGSGMVLAPGGLMKQQIYKDEHPLSHYDLDHGSRCFVHLCNSMVWREVTGQNPPTVPPTAKEYERAGLPWFDYYSETPAVEGAAKLAGLKSVAAMGKSKGDVPLPGNEPVDLKQVVTIHPKHPDQVREGEF